MSDTGDPNFPRNTLDAERLGIRITPKVMWKMVMGAVGVALTVAGAGYAMAWKMEKMSASVVAAQEAAQAGSKEAKEALARAIGDREKAEAALNSKLDALLVSVASARSDAWSIRDERDAWQEFKDRNGSLPMPLVLPDTSDIWRKNRIGGGK